MSRVERVVRLARLWVIVAASPGCAFLDEWYEDDGNPHAVEVGRLQPADHESTPPLHTLEPGVYPERR